MIKSILNSQHENSTYTKKSQEIILVKNKEENEPKETKIKIKNINDKIEFGKTFDLDMLISKGSTRKYSINAYVKGDNIISGITNIHARGSNIEYRAKIPIAINHNCEKKYEKGNYTLVIEGLGLKIKENITIKDSNHGCIEKILHKNKTNETKNKIFHTELDKFEYVPGETVKINHKIKDDIKDYTIAYWIENLYGEIVKPNLTTTNTNQKTWTINSEDKIFKINSILVADFQNETIEKYSEKYFIVKKEKEKQTDDEEKDEFETEITILDIQDNLEFGKTFDIELLISKGSTRRYSINAYVEGDNRISEITNIHARGSNVEYRTKVPIAINDNCEKKYEEGKYNLIIEGLDKKIEKEIEIEDNNAGCIRTIVTEEKEIFLETPEKPKVRSFYTLHRTYNEKINLYATFENIKEKTNLTFQSTSQTKKLQVKNNSRITIEADAKKGKNLYILTIDNIHTEYVIVDFTPKDENNKTDNNNTKEKISQEIDKETEKTSNIKIEENQGTKKTGSHEDHNKITGMALKIYESSSEKSKKTAIYLFCLLISASAIYAALKNRRKLYKIPLFLKPQWQNKK